jgi:hypothetical protein
MSPVPIMLFSESIKQEVRPILMGLVVSHKKVRQSDNKGNSQFQPDSPQCSVVSWSSLWISDCDEYSVTWMIYVPPEWL